MNLNIQFGQLADAIEKHKHVSLKHNEEVDIRDLGCHINTPTGVTLINHIIKKYDLDGIEIGLVNGMRVKCANKHILQQNNNDVLADTLIEGDMIDAIGGAVQIKTIRPINDTVYYDIGIDAPHLYYDSQGVLHHNTLMTASLSERVEQYGRSIVIVPNKSLVVQTEEDYINMQLDVGVFYGDRKEYGKQHTVCTWQSLNSLLKQTKNQSTDITIGEFLEGVVCVIVDECFDGDTLIKTRTGETPIKDIKKGDIVINLDESVQCYKEDIVMEVHENLADSHSEDMLELTFDNDKVINVTANHKFLTSNGWVRADCLSADLEVVTISTYSKESRHYTKLISIKIIKKPKKVYNLHIRNSHNYIANDAVVSNCHGIKADALKGLLTGAMAHIPLRWGFTGTMPKEDFEFKALEVSIGSVINKISAYDLQNQGVLAKCHVNIVQLIDLVEHTNYQSELKYLLSDESRLDAMADLIRKANSSGNTLVLVDRISAGKELVERLDGSVFVSGATKGKDRQEHYDEVAGTDDKIIIATYGVAAVGINIPRIFNLVLIEPGKSFVRVIQSIGRGVRKAKDKDFVQIWDITSTCKFAKRHLGKRKSFYREAGYPFSIEKLDWK